MDGVANPCILLPCEYFGSEIDLSSYTTTRTACMAISAYCHRTQYVSTLQYEFICSLLLTPFFTPQSSILVLSQTEKWDEDRDEGTYAGIK